MIGLRRKHTEGYGEKCGDYGCSNENQNVSHVSFLYPLLRSQRIKPIAQKTDTVDDVVNYQYKNECKNYRRFVSQLSVVRLLYDCGTPYTIITLLICNVNI